MERWIGVGLALGGLCCGVIGGETAFGAPSATWGFSFAFAQAAIGQPIAQPPVAQPRIVQQPAVAQPANPQRQPVQEEQEEPGKESEEAVDVFVPPPREIMKNLFAVRQLLSQGRMSEAIGFLQTILTAPEDYFFQPDPTRQTRLSLKSEAQRLLGEMPEEARQIYEIRYGPHARQLLREAVAQGDPERLSEISRCFFHTEAGYEATLLLGLDHLRSGRVLAAALILDRLYKSCPNPRRLEPTLSLALAMAWYRAKMPEQAQAVLTRLKATQGGKPIWVAGREVPWFTRDKDALAWLAQWAGSPLVSASTREDTGYLMVRNSPARNGRSTGGRPLLNLRWRVPTVDHPILEQWVQQLQQFYEDQGMPCVAQGIPLAVGDVVIMRSVENLLAIDFQTGKRLWESPVGEPVDTILAGQDQPIALGQATVVQTRVAQRIWLDATYSRLSSDGTYVFCIEEDSAWGRSVPGLQQVVIIQQGVRGDRRGGTGNRLVAYDIRTGKLQWEAGGLDEQEFTLPLAGTAFLGAPLPLMGQLYVLGETKNDIRLLVLDAQTGNLIWSQQLGVLGQEGPERPNFGGQDWPNRILGLSPSYAEGILVCPTGQGALVALDLATRTFLWAYPYLPQIDIRERRMAMINQWRAFGGQIAPVPGDGWLETTCIVADGRVLFTTPESRELYCLNLADGKELWKQSCPEGLYVACVHDGKVVWVGRRSVRAIQLADGEPAWEGRGIELPEGALPSGLGFAGGNKYYLPLSSAEVVTLDLNRGEIIHRARSRTGTAPGNLICFKDKVISQGSRGLEVYYQQEALEVQTEAQLAQNPDDPTALTMWAEILLDKGQRAEAVEALRRSFARQADPRTRQLLRETLLEGLQEDFAAYRRYLPEMENLLETPEHRASYERLLAEGYFHSGEYRPAWEMYQRLAQMRDQLGRLEQIDKVYAVRRDRWLEDQLDQFRGQAPPEFVQEMDRQIQQRLQEAIQSQDPIAGLVQFLNVYGNQPLADRARQELLSRLADGGRWLEAELLLREQARSGTAEQQRAAVAQLADLLRKAGRPAQAAAYYRQLLAQWADVPCQAGQTGRQILEALPPDDPVREIVQTPRWPQGRVEVKTTTITAAQPPYHGRFFLSMENISEPAFPDVRIVFDQNRRLILGYDRFGQEVWKPFPIASSSTPFLGFNRAWWRVYLQGHLMVLSTGVNIQAYDLAGVSGGDGPRLLWSQDLLNLGQMNTDEDSEQIPQMAMVAFLPMVQRVSSRPGMGVAIGPVSDRVVCFQKVRYLTAVDTLTGRTLWSRNNLPPGSELFGDQDRILVLLPDKPELLVLRTWDGKLLGKRPLPTFAHGLDGSGVPQANVMPFGQPAGIQVVNRPGASFSNSLRQYCLSSQGSRLLLWYPQVNLPSSGNVKQILRLYDLWEQKDVWGPMEFDLGTRYSVIEKEAVGVLEPNGQFTLVRIADGHVLVKDTLDSEPSLQGIHLMRLGDEYYVIPYGTPPSAQQMPQQPLPGMHFGQVPHGRMYGYSATGQRLWDRPVELEQQNVLLSQPPGLPVVIFATQRYERRGTSGGTFQVHLLVIDKSTGRKIYQEKFPYTTSVFQITGDPDKHTVDILLQRDKISMTFTEEPWPAEKTPVKQPTTLRQGLLRSFRDLIVPPGSPAEKVLVPLEQPLQPPRPATPSKVPVVPPLRNLPVPVPVPVPDVPDTR